MDYFLRTRWLCNLPKSKIRTLNGRFIVCELPVQSLSGHIYTLCINYEKNFMPKVWIINPQFFNVTLYPQLPHVYKQLSNALCLYHPDDLAWTPKLDIRKTLIVWSLAWIEYYEFFEISGDWIGPEADHQTRSINDSQCNLNVLNKKYPIYLKNYPITLDTIKNYKRRQRRRKTRYGRKEKK